MWVVYEKPLDYPNSWVARRWAIYEVLQPTPEMLIISPSLEVLEDILRRYGLLKLAPMPDDEPHIVATWI